MLSHDTMSMRSHGMFSRDAPSTRAPTLYPCFETHAPSPSQLMQHSDDFSDAKVRKSKLKPIGLSTRISSLHESDTMKVHIGIGVGKVTGIHTGGMRNRWEYIILGEGWNSMNEAEVRPIFLFFFFFFSLFLSLSLSFFLIDNAHIYVALQTVSSIGAKHDHLL